MADDIAKSIMTEFITVIRGALQACVAPIATRVRARVVELIKACPEWDAMISGDLAAQLGVINPESVMNSIADTVANNVTVNVDNVFLQGNDRIVGGLMVSILRSDFTDVLSLPGAAYSTNKGQVIPWLDWLLFAGDSQVVTDYKINISPANPELSRTGEAIMVPSPGSGWGVPGQYAGTEENNFLTRALTPIVGELEQIISQEFMQRI